MFTHPNITPVQRHHSRLGSIVLALLFIQCVPLLSLPNGEKQADLEFIAASLEGRKNLGVRAYPSILGLAIDLSHFVSDALPFLNAWKIYDPLRSCCWRCDS